MAGFLAPGEKLAIELTVLVDNGTVFDFNTGKERIEEIIILHLEGGIDYFVSLIPLFCVIP